MQGALALSRGVLHVGRQDATVFVRPYDLDGSPLARGFSLREPNGEACALAGLAADEDHRLWLGDRLSESVRSFSLFGRPAVAFSGGVGAGKEGRGSLSHLVDVCLASPDEDAEPWIVTARGGQRRHAVQVFTQAGQWIASLRPGGDPLGSFHDVRSVASLGRLVYACEGAPGRIQVFRDGEFHYTLRVPNPGGGEVEPVAVAPLSPERLVVACGGAASKLLLSDGAGRLIRVLAEAGSNLGQVAELTDVVAEPEAEQGEARIVAMDCDGERVQVFTLGGRCQGELHELPGRAL
jgi:hypothetical protein